MNESSPIVLQNTPKTEQPVSQPKGKQEWLPGVEQESQKRDEPRITGSKGKAPYVS